MYKIITIIGIRRITFSSKIARRSVEEETAKFYAKRNGLEYFETSCKQSQNVAEVFKHLCKAVLEKIHDGDDHNNYRENIVEKSVSIKNGINIIKQEKCCS